MKWKDSTSYSRDDKERIPSSYDISDGKELRITVHRLQGIKEDWFVSCPELRIQGKTLQSRDIDAAKREALSIVCREADRLHNSACRLFREGQKG